MLSSLPSASYSRNPLLFVALPCTTVKFGLAAIDIGERESVVTRCPLSKALSTDFNPTPEEAPMTVMFFELLIVEILCLPLPAEGLES